MEFIAGYQEAQTRLRMSTLCRDTVRPLAYPLWPRIVELAATMSQTPSEAEATIEN